MKTFREIAIAASAAMALGAAQAQPASAPTARSGTMSGADRPFVEKAAAGGLAEVAAGRIAQQQGNSDQVKQFGQRLVDDHSKANDELKQIAGAKGMRLPSSPTPEQQREAAMLAKMNGAAFDKAFMNHLVADHKKDIALFRKEASSGKDPELKAFAAKTLPTLQEHLKMAQSTQTKGGARTTTMNEGMKPAASAPR